MKKRFSILVKGKVQGVYFRASTKQMAESLGIVGFVRNEHNGDVYIEAEAEEEMLVKFTQWCHQGPDAAEVEKVSIREMTAEGTEKFEIRRG